MKLCLQCNLYFDDAETICPTDQAELQSVGKDPLIGALINNRYVIETVIGKGSSGIVYKATRMQRGDVVAVKVLHSYLGADTGSLDRFLREAEAASRLRYQHIITIWDSGVTDDGLPFFVMDYLEGVTLARLIKAKGSLPVSRALPIIRQIAEALNEAHTHGIIHRDLKPENIMLQETDSGEDYVKVLDFGIADAPNDAPQLEKPKTVAGSPAYMSPEQCQGYPLDQRSDIYSLAIVVFEMLTGRRPIEGEDHVHMMYNHVNQPPKRLADACPQLRFPAALEEVMARALSKNPLQRQENVIDFWLELEAAAQELMTTTLSSPSQSSGKIVTKVPIVSEMTEPAPLEAKTQVMTPAAGLGSASQTNPSASSTNLSSRLGSAQTEHGESGVHNMKARMTAARTYDNSPILTNHFRVILAVIAVVLGVTAIIALKFFLEIHSPQTAGEVNSGILPFTQGNYDSARKTLEQKQQSGSLSQEETDNLNAAYLNLAKENYEAKKYEDAMALIDKIPADSPSFAEAARLFNLIRKARQ